MIKSLIILVLVVLLAGGAFLSRPDMKDFEEYLRAQKTAKPETSLAGGLFGGDPVAETVQKSTLKDRYLWVTIEQDGRTAYVGVFSQFWPTKESKSETPPAVEKTELAPAPAPAKDAPKDASARWPSN